MNNDFLLRIFLHCHSWQKTLFSSALKTHLSSYVYVQEFAFIKGRNFCTKTSLEFSTHWNIRPTNNLVWKTRNWHFFLFRGCKGGIFVLAWKVIHSPKEHGNFFFLPLSDDLHGSCPWLKQHIVQSGAQIDSSHTQIKRRIATLHSGQN